MVRTSPEDQDTRLLAEEARQGSQQLPGDGHTPLAPRPGRRQLGGAGHLLLTRAHVGRVADQQVNLRTSTICTNEHVSSTIQVNYTHLTSQPLL